MRKIGTILMLCIALLATSCKKNDKSPLYQTWVEDLDLEVVTLTMAIDLNPNGTLVLGFLANDMIINAINNDNDDSMKDLKGKVKVNDLIGQMQKFTHTPYDKTSGVITAFYTDENGEVIQSTLKYRDLTKDQITIDEAEETDTESKSISLKSMLKTITKAPAETEESTGDVTSSWTLRSAASKGIKVGKIHVVEGLL